ncbi:2TM domain-containing protein [Hymenobacter sp. BT664]|uniref:2TM domain-containing protein n=1 Tax=Hymenobacter montanus TaxID=2771359 RepID=A0A927BAJ6_9BACT|nr:2TM domain-containing protein [Hymenobacter montanus]MBD2766562.1 2TM domain-containing protein [Hymenobacter montanus]
MEPLNRDPYLWQKAKARAKFKSHLVVYLVINTGFWVIWALTDQGRDGLVPWPVWAGAFWGLGLAMNGLAAYGGLSEPQRTQREYERLLREQDGRNSVPQA